MSKRALLPVSDAVPAALAGAPRPWIAQVMLDTVRAVGARIGLFWIAFLAFCAIFAPFLANSYPLLLKTEGAWSSPMLQHLTPTDVTLLVGFAAWLVTLLIPRLSSGQRVLIALVILLAMVPLTLWPAMFAWIKDVRRDWPIIANKPARVASIILAGLALVAAVGLMGLILFRMRLTTRGRTILISVLALLVLVFTAALQVRPSLREVFEEYREMEADGQVEFILRAPIPYSPKDRLRDQVTLDRPHPWPPSWVYHMGKRWDFGGPRPPWHEHLLGTEKNRSDILSRMIHAARIAMAIGFISTGLALIIGVIIGGLMGYFAGWVDLLGMRVVEVFGAIPTIYLLLAFVAFFDRNLYLIMVIIGLTGWVGDARFVRAEFLKLRKQDFVHAAVAAGLPLRSILFRHLLPNAMAPLLVSVSFGIASAILTEATLSFLGLGLVEEPSWGQLLSQAVSAGGSGFHWWLAIFPGLAIFFTVFSYNLIGESLRDALDPRLKKA